MSSTNIKDLSIICDRSNKNSDFSYKINFGNLGFDSFNAISIKSVSFRNLQYNVIGAGNSRQNNTFYFDLAASNETIVVPPGYYSVYELTAYLQTEIEIILAASGIIPLPTLTSFDYSSITGKVSLLIDGNGSATNFELTGGTNTNSVNNLLGNSTDAVLNTLAPTIEEFDSFVNLQGDDRVHLVSSSIAPSGGITNASINGTSVNGRNINLLRSIVVNAPFGELVEYTSNDLDAEQLLYTLPQNFSVLDISLEDVYGNKLDLGNSAMTIDILAWKAI